MAGVRVTDGHRFVETDRRGCYRLPATEEAEFVYLTLPDGYEIPAREGAATLYRRIDPEQPAHYDFTPGAPRRI